MVARGMWYHQPMGVTFDRSRWPVVTARFDGVMTDVEFDEYLVRYAAAVREGPVAIVLDALASGIPSLGQQQRQARWMRETRALMQRNCVGVAFVIESATLRFVLSAILLLAPMAVPYTVVSAVAEAEAWCAAQLQRARASRPKVASAG